MQVLSKGRVSGPGITRVHRFPLETAPLTFRFPPPGGPGKRKSRSNRPGAPPARPLLPGVSTGRQADVGFCTPHRARGAFLSAR
jgi:hypothetical protein